MCLASNLFLCITALQNIPTENKTVQTLVMKYQVQAPGLATLIFLYPL